MTTIRAIAVMGALLAAACTEGRRVDGDGEGAGGSEGEGEERSCDELSWRAPVEGEVACPGASDCACGGGEVCCVEVNDDFEVLDASCGIETACRGLVFACDGPEDCGPEEVCCAVMTSGGGSWCVEPSECFGLDELTMCHGDDHCDGLDHCTPSVRESYFEGTAATCQM